MTTRPMRLPLRRTAAPRSAMSRSLHPPAGAGEVRGRVALASAQTHLVVVRGRGVRHTVAPPYRRPPRRPEGRKHCPHQPQRLRVADSRRSGRSSHAMPPRRSPTRVHRGRHSQSDVVRPPTAGAARHPPSRRCCACRAVARAHSRGRRQSEADGAQARGAQTRGPGLADREEEAVGVVVSAGVQVESQLWLLAQQEIGDKCRGREVRAIHKGLARRHRRVSVAKEAEALAIESADRPRAPTASPGIAPGHSKTDRRSRSRSRDSHSSTKGRAAIAPSSPQAGSLVVVGGAATPFWPPPLPGAPGIARARRESRRLEAVSRTSRRIRPARA
eukprot:scaffold21818_cov28-Tisochrysis_lutea.AAC.2